MLPVVAQDDISLDSLGELALTYATAELSQQVQKSVSTGEVEAMPGADLRLMAPMSPQQVHYLVADGAMVNEGQKLALLRGSEVHHFTQNLQGKKALYDIAKKRFEINKPLFESNAISQSAWLSIAQNYYDAKLAWGHLDHFAEIFVQGDDEDEGFLIAPEAGLFRYANDESNAELTSLGAIIKQDTLRLTTYISTTLVHQVSALTTSRCQVGVARTEEVVTQYLTKIWSELLPDNCQLKLGQRTQVNAYINLQAYKVPAESVFYYHGQPSIFVLNNRSLTVTPVEIVGQLANEYLQVSAQATLNNQQVLASSVSAVQGVLLGLGGVE
ncbi:hypothetical protein [Alteromonas gracilis]|uniref:hypothetical protein n=1 Tax=Alteromonas gracilis TaxID=1479524 RepID=UPI0030CC41B9